VASGNHHLMKTKILRFGSITQLSLYRNKTHAARPLVHL
jgi:hypothetical protein